MNPIDQLKSVLCDHEGKCCISGSDEDRAIIDRALRALTEPAVEPSTDDSSVLSACQKLAQAFKTSPPPPAGPAERKHITDGPACWCNPETVYTDPDTGTSVIVHKEPQ